MKRYVDAVLMTCTDGMPADPGFARAVYADVQARWMRATMWSDRPALAQVAEPALAQLYQIWVRLEAADAAAATAAAEAAAATAATAAAAFREATRATQPPTGFDLAVDLPVVINLQARARGNLGRAWARLCKKWREEDILEEAWGYGELTTRRTQERSARMIKKKIREVNRAEKVAIAKADKHIRWAVRGGRQHKGLPPAEQDVWRRLLAPGVEAVMEDLIGKLEEDAAVEDELHEIRDEMELWRDFILAQRPDDWEAHGLDSESDGDDYPDRADPVGLGRALEQQGDPPPPGDQPPGDPPSLSCAPAVWVQAMASLQAMGFNAEECAVALDAANGSVELAG